MKLSILHRAWLAHLKGLNRRPQTLAAYESDFSAGLNEFLPQDDVRAVTTARMEQYPAWLARQRLAPGTIYRRVSHAASFCRWLRRTRHIAVDPFEGIERPKKPERYPRPVPTASVALLLAGCRTARERALIRCLYEAGLRVQEVCDLDVDAVDAFAGRLTVRQGKGGKDRAIPLSQPFRDALTDWCLTRGDGAGALFPGREGPRTSRKTIGRLVSRLARLATLPHCTPHQLRHSFGTESVQAGVSPSTLQKLMGHRSLDTTMLYVRVSGKDLEDGVKELEAWRARQAETGAAGGIPGIVTPGVSPKPRP